MTATPGSVWLSMFLMSLTTEEMEYSLKIVIWLSISRVERPRYCQMTLTTGMSMLGKMSVGVCWNIGKPRITISSARTTKVYGRLSASLTIHITSSPFEVEGSGRGSGRGRERHQGDPPVQAKHVGDELEGQGPFVAVPSGACEGGVDDAFAQRDGFFVHEQLSVLQFVAGVFVHHGFSPFTWLTGRSNSGCLKKILGSGSRGLGFPLQAQHHE